MQAARDAATALRNSFTQQMGIQTVDMAECEVALAHGVWLRPFGRLLYTMPPYVTTDDDVDCIATAMVAIAEHVAPG